MAETLTLPGLVDIHVHLREPSPVNQSETYDNGTRMLLMSGFALACDMPNTPGNETWTVTQLYDKHFLSRRKAWIPMGQNVGSQPTSDNLQHIPGMMRQALAMKFYFGHTTGNDTDYDVGAFREAAEIVHAATPDKPILAHAVGAEVVREVIGMIAQDLDHPLHICHTHQPDEVRAVSEAKRRGLPVTVGVTPHHLFLTSHETVTKSWFARMIPELAHQNDAEELFSMLSSGEIDIVESDYAPHSKDAKWKAIEENPQQIDDPKNYTTCYGVGGIEHAVPMLLRQAQLGAISMERLVDAMSTAPARLLGVTIGEDTKVTWSTEEYRIETEVDVMSGTGTTPYLGALARGRVIESTIQGRVVVQDGEPIKLQHRPVTDRGITL